MELIEAGVDVIRMNFSHGSHAVCSCAVSMNKLIKDEGSLEDSDLWICCSLLSIHCYPMNMNDFIGH